MGKEHLVLDRDGQGVNQALSVSQTIEEWPAVTADSVMVLNKEGKIEEIPFVEWLKRIGNNNRAGT